MKEHGKLEDAIMEVFLCSEPSKYGIGQVARWRFVDELTPPARRTSPPFPPSQEAMERVVAI